jgi:hypothetical protein
MVNCSSPGAMAQPQPRFVPRRNRPIRPAARRPSGRLVGEGLGANAKPNNPMKTALHMKRHVAVVGAILACASWAHAQSAPTSAAPNPDNRDSSPAPKDDVVLLSPFEVSTVKDTGYQATETLAGTRIRTDLKDVGSAISVVTREFLNDVGATDNSTLLQYTPNADVAGTRGTYSGLGSSQTLYEGTPIKSNQRIRGLNAADNTRDFFLTEIPWDSYNVDRIDIQRGPNSILFGLGSPAGIINASTRSAEFRDMGSFEVRAGSYGTVRAALDVNQELVKNTLAFRIDGLWNDQKYQQDQAFRKDKRLFGAVRWDPHFFSSDFNTSIRVKAETGKIDANMPRTSTPYDSITPWFDSLADGGAGQYAVTNLYAIGSAPQNTNYWLGAAPGQQTPVFFFDGANGQLSSITAGYINNGFLKDDGTYAGPSNNAVGQRYSEQVFGLTNYQTYATNAKLPFYNYAQYKNKMLQDSSVFDFYHHLIDGDNKGEWAQWDAYNVSLSQTGWQDRVGLELAYDYQKYKNGSWSFLGDAPALNIDVTQVLQDGSTNPNFGRPFLSSTAGGTGTSTTSERESLRASLYGELRASDFLSNSFLVKLLGRHRFNFLGSRETYDTETLNWNRYANDNAWDAFTTHTSGNTNLFTYRAPVSWVYLGSSLKGASSAADADLQGIDRPISLNGGPVYLFNSQWNSDIDPTSVWSVPAGDAHLNMAYNPALVTTQASNPANYVGWNNQMHLNTLSFNEGAPLYTSAARTQRVINSYAGTWQGFLWGDSIVPTLGWRYDEVKTRSVSAKPDNANKGYLKMDQASYSLPDFTPAGKYKGHSLSGGVVVHLNQALPESWDKLPFNVSLSYNNSQNFQAQSARVDLYGHPIANPAGKTIDYGIQLSTKDNRFSFRAIKYTTKVSDATVSTDSGFVGPIVQGLKFRNIFLYKLTGYTWDTRRPYGDPGPDFNNRNYWTRAFVDASGRPVQTINYLNDPNQYGATVPATSVKLESQAEADAHRDASIEAWNNIQGWLAQKGFFDAWSFTPTTQSALTNRSTYEASLDPATNLPTNSQYMPDTSTVVSYGPITPSGYAITGNTESSGYEFELTANITSNWRLAFNASKTTATNTSIGGGDLDELVSYIDTQMAGVAGDMRQYNGDYVANNEVRRNWSNWRAGYTLLKLREKTDASELRKWRYNIVTNYSFTHGRLKGVGVGGAYRWQDKVVIGYPVYLDDKGFAAYDLSKPYYGPSEDGVDLWLSYEHKLTDKIDWKIQLNVSNAFQRNGLIPITVEPDGQTWAGVRMKPVQEWMLTNTFSF